MSARRPTRLWSPENFRVLRSLSGQTKVEVKSLRNGYEQSVHAITSCIVHSASSGANGLSTTGGVFFFAANSKTVSATKTKPLQIKRGIVIAFHGLQICPVQNQKDPFFIFAHIGQINEA